MDSSMSAFEIFHRNVVAFQKICELYKSILDKNYGGRFCIGGHCRTIFMVEMRLEGEDKWGASPKMFYSKEAAEKEVEYLKRRYFYFISECRIVTRRIEERKE